MKFLLILFLLGCPLAARELYHSDSLGTAGQKAQSTGEGEWILLLESEGLVNRRVLYKEGKPYKSWERESFLEEGELRTLEKYFFGDQLRSETVLGRGEELLEERFYDSLGAMIIENRFTYNSEGRLIQILRREDDETHTAAFSLRYRDSGALSRLDSDRFDRIDWRAGDYEHQFLDTLYLQEGDRSSLYRYDREYLSSQILNYEGVSYEERYFHYSNEGFLESEVVLYPDTGRRREIKYDSSGNIVMENRYDSDILVSSLVNTWMSGRLLRSQERSAGIRKLTTYEYSDQSEDPVLIKEFRNGQLIKQTELTDLEEVITLYRNNEIAAENRIPREEP
ncbi:MAG: hypothetical protein PQJ50_16930 [Spirochaetales bacterium]|nr:hypothetical protein [Spirochaetales bacterium]